MGSDSIRKDINRAIANPVWDQPNPKKTSKSLSADDKAAARTRAANAGRPYPNLIDNMWAARRQS